MLFTECDAKAQFFYAPQHMFCDVRAFGPIAQIFREVLFVAVRSNNSCLNAYRRHLVLLSFPPPKSYDHSRSSASD